MNNTTLSPSSFHLSPSLHLSPSPTFSIIIPVYNVAPYLRECLDSVCAAVEELKKAGGERLLANECDPLVEIICVDDGSTDGSGEMLDEYSRRSAPSAYTFKIIHQQNAGVSVARNVALDVAMGEWVSFLDADDSIRADYFVAFLLCEDKLDVNFLNMSYVYSDGLRVERIMRQLKCPMLKNEIEPALRVIVHGGDGYDALGWTWNKIIKREIIVTNKVRFVEGVSYFEDELFAFDLFRHVKSFQILAAPVYRYRRNAGGLTAQGMKNAQYERLIRCYIVRAKAARLTLLKDLAILRIREWLRKSLRNKDVSVVALSKVFIEFQMNFPELYRNRRIVRMLTTRWIPMFMQVRMIAFMFAVRRLWC